MLLAREKSDFTNGATNVIKQQIINILNKELHNKVIDILEILTTSRKRAELLKILDLTNQSYNRRKYLDPLIKLNWKKKNILMK